MKYHCIEQAFLDSVLPVLSVILDPGALFSFPAASEHVFVRMIIKSVLMLGRRTFGATTPQASLSRRFMLRVALCRGWKQKRRFLRLFNRSPISRKVISRLIDRNDSETTMLCAIPHFVRCNRIFREDFPSQKPLITLGEVTM